MPRDTCNVVGSSGSTLLRHVGVAVPHVACAGSRAQRFTCVAVTRVCFTCAAAMCLVACGVCWVRPAGLCAAPFTSFNEDGSLDVDGGVKSVVASLAANKVRYAFVGGTTGESLKMTTAERKQLLERWLAVIAETSADVTVIAHVGAESLGDTLDLAKHAASVGAPAVAVMPSVFFKPPALDALVDVRACVSRVACIVSRGACEVW